MNASRTVHFIYAMVATAAVFVFAHWDGLTNPYIIRDDVRQQVFWMQQWQDPELYQNDLLTEYSRNYVPWGIKGIYWVGARVMNPVQFTKVVTAVLFLLTAGFLFGLGTAFRDELVPVFVVCVFLFFGAFMRKISGGLSQGFAFPCLAAYLFFLSRNMLMGTGAVIFVLSFVNPYMFLLCLGAQAVYLVTHRYGKAAVTRLGLTGLFPEPERYRFRPLGLGICTFLIAAGCAVMAMQYVMTDSSAFGRLITWTDMVGKIEYTDRGRYELFPIPSLFYELRRPWIFNLPFIQWGQTAGWLFAAMGVPVLLFALTRRNHRVDLTGFKVFGYLCVASLALYLASCVLFFRLFVPRRYVEFSAVIFYCVAVAVCLKIAVGSLVTKRVAFPVVTSLLVVLAALRLSHVGLYDFSDQASLYRFLETTPRTSVIAGHPDLMDNVLTFSRRKAFVTYELSHTWYTRYWDIIKGRTFDFFSAYYASDPEVIREFCNANHIDYLVVRDEDFSAKALRRGKIYFEPFDSFIRDVVKGRTHFAILDPKAFPPIYLFDGVRVLKCR
jgi:hypothetical protein